VPGRGWGCQGKHHVGHFLDFHKIGVGVVGVLAREQVGVVDVCHHIQSTPAWKVVSWVEVVVDCQT
jgi:hypothetical protein